MRRVPARLTAALCALLAASVAGVLLATGALALVAHPSGPSAAHPAMAAAGGRPAAARAAPPPGSTAAARPAGPAEQAARPVDPAPVAPLGRLTPPDVAVYLPAAVPAGAWNRLRRLPGVAAATAVSRGFVDTPAGRLVAIGVDPNRFRSFTPKRSAASDGLWRQIASGSAAFDFSVAPRMRGLLGATVRVGARPVRVGAFASLGLPGTAVVVDRAVGAALGLAAGREILVSAPHAGIGWLTAALRGVLGPGAVVRVLRPAEVDQAQVSALAAGYIPASYLRLYRAAARTCPGLPWTVLAAIGTVETGNGADVRRSSAGAEGPMQFLPATFAAFGVAVGPGHAPNINSPADAIFSAARYLCAEGAGLGGQSLYDAIFAYNHAAWYVREVLAIARRFA